jgi:2,5-furandicarboxylate decarboxylase 1
VPDSSPSLRTFLAGQLGEPVRRVPRQVSGDRELSAVVKAVEQLGNPVLRFDDVEGSEVPVIVGVTATRSRIARALGQDVDRCVEYLLEQIENPVAPERVADGPVQEQVITGSELDVMSLPIGVHSPEDAGPYITSGVLLVRDPDSGATNAGIYRTMVKDSRTLTVNVAPQHDLARILNGVAASGRPVDFAIVIGGHPTVAIASQAKNPVGQDTLALMGSLQGQPLETVRGVTVDVDVPAQAEIIIEGRLSPDHKEPEGPFGEFTYYYRAAQGWIAEVTAITRRSDAVYVDLHPAHVEHRCLWLFPGREARLLTMLRAGVPTVRAVRLPFHGAALSTYISLTKTDDGDARRALLLAMSSDTYVKHAFAFDPDIDIFDDEAVMWALNTRFQADRDLIMIPRCRGVRMDPSGYDYLDRSAPGHAVTKAGFDVTMPLSRPFGPRADLPAPGFEDLNPADYLAIGPNAQHELSTRE